MIDHFGFPVADVDASVAAYLRLFAPLGLHEAVRIPHEGSAVVGLAGPGGPPQFWLTPGGALDSELHVAFSAPDRAAVDAVTEPFARWCADLGLTGDPALRYRPRSKASTADGLAAELRERIDGDLERGFTGHGPHRDDLVVLRAGREIRAYGSQGQQRLALLSLLLAERDALARHRDVAPLLLLDDVMSELDRQRRRALVDLLRSTPGQAVITATDLDQVPGAEEPGVVRLAVSDGRVLGEVLAA